MIRSIHALVTALLLAASTLASAADLGKALVLVAKPELNDAMYRSTILVVTPVGSDQHMGFIVNRPTRVRLGELFPEDGPSQKVVDPVYLGGPVGTQAIFALVQGRERPGGKSFELMPGLHAVLDADAVDGVIRAQSERARFLAGFVAWRQGELREEIEQGAWYVLEADASLALRKPDGLWEELVRRSRGLERAI